MLVHLRRLHNLNRYREIVTILARHGFGSFLEYVQVNRRLSLPSALLRQNASMHQTPAEHLRLACEELGPTFIKLGQVLSTRPDLLPPAYITELSKLRDAVPPSPWEDVRAILVQELGQPPEDIFVSIDPHPLGAASLAQVYAATLRASAGDPSQALQQVVIKVQRPNIQATIDADLEILEDLASLAQRTPLGELYNPIDVVAEFAFTLRNELDYWHEGRNAERFRANFAGEPQLYIPRVYWDYTSRRVLVMEHIYGIKIDDLTALDAAGCDRHQVAVHSTRLIVKEILQDGFFHADPHPGNFLVMPGNVIGAMDFGMVGHLTDANRQDLIRLYIAAVRMDVEGVVEQILRMSATSGRVDRRGLVRDVGRLLGKYHGASLKDVRAVEVVDEIVGLAFRHHLHMTGDLWLVSKTMAMLEGLGQQLDPDFDILEVTKPFADSILRELWSPKMWGPGLLSGLESWGHLLSDIPRVGASLLRDLEQGELPLNVRMEARKETMDRLDRLITRLSLSILIAAFVIGLAFVVPVAAGNSILLILTVVGFIAVLMLGLWLMLSILRPGK